MAQASDGRIHILGEMAKAISGAREELSANTRRRSRRITIPTDKIREVIGTGGKVIREIVATTGAKVDINDDGVVKVSASDAAKIKAAMDWIKSITSEPEVGQIYDGKVVKLVDFGAFVNFFGAKDGLVHVSQIANERVAKPSDVLQEGQTVKVKLLGLRRPRQGAPVDEGRRPDDRRGPDRRRSRWPNRPSSQQPCPKGM